jgi:integrase/recombinase XerD
MSFYSYVRPLPESSPPDSFELLCEHYLKHAVDVRQVRSETARKQLAYLERFFLRTGPHRTPGDLFERLAPGLIGDFLIDYAESHSVGARRWMHLSLRMFLRYCHEYGYLSGDLSALVPAVRTPKSGRIPCCLPDECIAAIGTDIKRDTEAGRRDAAIVWLLATYGIRGVQIRRLRLDHIDWLNERIHFPAAKGGRPIEQHLTSEVGNRLSDYIVHARPPSPCPEVFLTLREPFRVLRAPCLSWILRRRLDKLDADLPAGVSRGTHGFRHAFAARMTGRVPFKEVSDLMGHRDPDSTLIYGKIDADALRQAALPWPGGDR